MRTTTNAIRRRYEVHTTMMMLWHDGAFCVSLASERRPGRAKNRSADENLANYGSPRGEKVAHRKPTATIVIAPVTVLISEYLSGEASISIAANSNPFFGSAWPKTADMTSFGQRNICDPRWQFRLGDGREVSEPEARSPPGSARWQWLSGASHRGTRTASHRTGDLDHCTDG